MERFSLDEDEAFEAIKNASQETNIKVHAVARWLVGEALDRRANAVPPDTSPKLTGAT